MIDRMKLLDTLLDNQDVSDDVLVPKVESLIAKGIGFRHKEENPKDACNVVRKASEIKRFKERYDKFSEEVEAIEEAMTKRELAMAVITLGRTGVILERKLKKLKGED